LTNTAYSEFVVETSSVNSFNPYVAIGG